MYSIPAAPTFAFAMSRVAILVRRKRQSMTSLQSNSYNGCAFSSSPKLKFSGALLGTRMHPLFEKQNNGSYFEYNHSFKIDGDYNFDYNAINGLAEAQYAINVNDNEKKERFISRKIHK